MPEIRMCGIMVLWCAEIGGIMLTIYLKYKSYWAHVLFVFIYGISRILFTIAAINMTRAAFRKPGIVDDIIGLLVCVLVLINWNFWWKHVTKLLRRL